AAQLLQEFQTDTEAADKRYQGKALEISGVVERCSQQGAGARVFFVILHAGDENAKIKIECFFDLLDEEDEPQIVQCSKGQTITGRGEYGGRVSNVQLRLCTLVK